MAYTKSTALSTDTGKVWAHCKEEWAHGYGEDKNGVFSGTGALD